MLWIIFFTSPMSAEARSCGVLNRANSLFTTRVVFSSRVRADRMVPISILNGSPCSSIWSPRSAVMRGGFSRWSACSIFFIMSPIEWSGKCRDTLAEAVYNSVMVLILSTENIDGLELSRDEEEALAGKQGEALASAYRILAAIGEATGAKKLVPIKWAHVSGVNYNTIGDAGV